MYKIIFSAVGKIYNSEKKLVLLIFILTFVAAVTQILNIILVGPLALAFFNPDLILQTEIISKLNKNEINIKEENIFALICGAFLITFILTNLITLFKNTIQIYLVERVKIFSSTNLLNKFFRSELNNIRNLQKSELDRIINIVTDKFAGFSSSIFGFFEAILSILFISITIILVNKFVIFGIILILLLFSLFYLIFNKLNKKFYSEEIETRKKLYVLNTNFLHGYLDIILNKMSKKYTSLYRDLYLKLSYQKIKKNFIETIPKNLIQILMYSILISILIYSNFQINKGSFIFDLSIIGFATIRLIPYISSGYKEITSLKQNLNSYKNLENFSFDKSLKTYKSKNKIVNFKNTFELKAKYWFKENKVFNYNLKVNKADKILITGPSGSGKSTLMNIMSGIISPKEILNYIIDGKKVKKNTVLDNNFISYLDQNGLIYEGTILQNITNFQRINSIDTKKLKKIYSLVGLNTFINSFNDLSKIKLDFDPKNLSGGQRQRILLARCFYKNANIYLLDESMNQLDKKSENQILKNIFKFFNNKTFFVVSHRPQNKYFNKIVNLK